VAEVNEVGLAGRLLFEVRGLPLGDELLGRHGGKGYRRRAGGATSAGGFSRVPCSRASRGHVRAE
jgi:hypothetical protein